MISFDQSVCNDLDRAARLEWLETNGLGGFASSTITGLNTRRYHGLLTAATHPPVGRMLLLAKLEETLLVNGQHFDLSTNQYPGTTPDSVTLYPQGYRYLKQFRLDPFPTFVYEVAGVEVKKSLFLVHGENTVVVEYELRPLTSTAVNCVLELRPLIAFRDYHSTTHHNDALDRTVSIREGTVSITPYHGLPTLQVAHNAQHAEETGNWYFNFHYAAERERGLDESEDLFNPFVLRYELTAGKATVIASISSTNANAVHSAVPSANEAAELQRQEQLRRSEVTRTAPSPNPFIQKLTAAADQFIVKRGDLHTVIAGYHWFGDWGRDTMVALPGLTLLTGRFEIARDILRAFVDSADRGMLPNRFPDSGEQPEYNTVDASLWLFEAVRSYLHYTGDEAFVRASLYPKLKDMLEWHFRGTRYGIHAGPDGLLWAGEPGVQLTWMDAKVGDWVVTPRIGKPVEIQALWYNALATLRDMAEEFGDADYTLFLRRYAETTRESFNAQFWNETAGCLYDVVNGQDADASIRPNQIFAVSLHHRMLPSEKEHAVVQAVERELLTPLGLRTLSPRDPNYRPRYEGGVRERDSAYHQGTVWPWLMGPFLSAYVKVHHRSHKARLRAEWLLEAFEQHMSEAGLGQISEIADGDAPHTPRGCIAQAWSVAELLRAAVEDVYEIPVGARAMAQVGHE